MARLETRTLSVFVDRQAKDVYTFVSNPKNLPKWAPAFCKSIRKSGKDWIVKTLEGSVKFRFAPRNKFGVLDHYVYPMPEIEIYVPMRVIAKGKGSVVLFTLFRLPEMSAKEFRNDVRLVELDLLALKDVLEKPSAR